MEHWHEMGIMNTAWKASVFGVILVCILPHSDWKHKINTSLCIQSECGKMQTRTTLYKHIHNRQWNIHKIITYFGETDQWYLNFLKTIVYRDITKRRSNVKDSLFLRFTTWKQSNSSSPFKRQIHNYAATMLA